jgi:hypothetical protein
MCVHFIRQSKHPVKNSTAHAACAGSMPINQRHVLLVIEFLPL